MLAALIMKRLIALVLVCVPGAVMAAPAQDIGTLPIGHYTCELPGHALSPSGIHRPELDFDILNASSYRAAGTAGSYLLVGDILTLTGGTRRGQRFRRLRTGLLRMIGPNGSDHAIRCFKQSRNNR